MTNTLLARPCVLCAAASSSSRARNFRQALPFFLQSKKGLVSQCSAVLLDCAAEDGKTKLPIHSDAVVVGPFSRYGKSKFEGGFLNPRRFSTQAANINDAGSIDSTLMMSMEKKIKEQLNAESVSVKDAYGDGRHVSIDVIASTFEGQSSVNRQRMVYKAIWEELQNTVHAVDQMTTKTPDEAAGEK